MIDTAEVKNEFVRLTGIKVKAFILVIEEKMIM